MNKKKEIVKRLVESKAITFDEALLLLETEKEYIYYPYQQYNPWITTPPNIITYNTDEIEWK